MNILVDIGHPAHVHFFKNAIRIWRAHGHAVVVTTRRIPMAMHLMDVCGIEYAVVSKKRRGVVGLAIELCEHSLRLYPRLRRAKIDVCVSIGGTFMVHAAALAGCRRIVFYDTDTASTANAITYPFATMVVTPEAYPPTIGRKQVRYRGLHELAYLHPNYFSASPLCLRKYGLSEDKPYSVIRLCSWEA